MDRMKEQFNCDIDKLKDELSEAIQKGEEFERSYVETKAQLEQVTMKLSMAARELETQKEMNQVRFSFYLFLCLHLLTIFKSRQVSG